MIHGNKHLDGRLGHTKAKNIKHNLVNITDVTILEQAELIDVDNEIEIG